jgi:hypothetical protein
MLGLFLSSFKNPSNCSLVIEIHLFHRYFVVNLKKFSLSFSITETSYSYVFQRTSNCFKYKSHKTILLSNLDLDSFDNSVNDETQFLDANSFTIEVSYKSGLSEISLTTFVVVCKSQTDQVLLIAFGLNPDSEYANDKTSSKLNF